MGAIEVLNYTRKCNNCNWEDDVKHKHEDFTYARKDFFLDAMYECPECGSKSLVYTFYDQKDRSCYTASIKGFVDARSMLDYFDRQENQNELL